jgi:hypothetical protein
MPSAIRPPDQLVMGYYVAMLGNTLPLPGGIAGVEGGMIGSFLAFGSTAASSCSQLATERPRTGSRRSPA